MEFAQSLIRPLTLRLNGAKITRDEYFPVYSNWSIPSSLVYLIKCKCVPSFSTCSNGTFACGKESCEEQIVCPKNQVYRKGVTACRKTCELYGREMICDSDVLMDGCVCDESNNQTAYMAPDVRYNSPNTPQKPSKNTPTTEKRNQKRNKTKQKQHKNKNNTQKKEE